MPIEDRIRICSKTGRIFCPFCVSKFSEIKLKIDTEKGILYIFYQTEDFFALGTLIGRGWIFTKKLRKRRYNIEKGGVIIAPWSNFVNFFSIIFSHAVF